MSIPASSSLAWRGADARPAGRVARARLARSFADRYLALLGVGLLGYALLGRGFAYLGVPPLFVGEALLGAGLVALAGTRRLGTVLALGPMPLLAALMLLVLVRTLPYLGAYGLFAVRDAMVVGYGLFGFVVAALLVARPERLRRLLLRYQTFVVVLLALSAALYYTFRQSPGLFPTWPWAPNVHVFENKAGDLLVHLAAITAFLAYGLRRASPPLLALLLFSVGVLMVGNRGGMLGYLLAAGVMLALKPPEARLGRLGYVGVALLAILLLVDTTGLRTNEGSRAISLEQVWENAKSMLGKSDATPLNATVEWRLQWWEKIAAYTLDGPYFWTGKGFGLNIARDDGFTVDLTDPLRSPHNVHMTILARAGVPGFALWVAVLGAWFASVLRAWVRARRARQGRWMSAFALAVVYALAALVNATFDVYLEGPMGAIWFWTVFGAGVGAVWIHRHRPDVLAEPPRPSAPAVPWSWPAGSAANPARP